MGTIYCGYGYVLYHFFIMDLDYNLSSCNVCFSMFSTSRDAENDVNVWHARLGHIGQQRMNILAKEGLLANIDKVVLSTCEFCLAGKIARKPFGKGTRVEFPLQLVHSNICGPIKLRARHEAFYFITFLDDYTRFGFVYLISHKSEAFNYFNTYRNFVENQLDRKIKTLRTDRGREYLYDQFKELYSEKGRQHQLRIPRTPQQNGVTE